MVSVCMITYNHELYIRDALDGVIMQRTNFKIELIIGEDSSNDETRKICEDYTDKYPELIQLLPSDRNLGMSQNGIRTLQSCKGKYIALLEGDDYWTDPFKLQKQVNFFEENPDYALCLHNVTELNDFSSTNRPIPNFKINTDLSIEDYILNNKTATCAILFRRSTLGVLPTWFTQLPFGDLGLILILLKNSNRKARILVDNMAVYRVHGGGIHGSFRSNDKGLIKAYEQHLLFNEIIKAKLFNNNKSYAKIINQKFYNTHQILSQLYSNQSNIFKYLKSIFLMRYYKIINN